MKISGLSLLQRDEPPGAVPHARWCGRGPVKAGPYPDVCYVAICELTFSLELHTAHPTEHDLNCGAMRVACLFIFCEDAFDQVRTVLHVLTNLVIFDFG